ncbi:conserved hypothetical protein [Lebetimonas natsushimae]|uniref:SIMPL domain-containing protein n=1 Tax=Lebetimonas natsushimae TaxID=1936991 RepID=A0A292YA06_9BACT|nr:SIMPL domain-containing protein [Lebetimonas natsushimae]GAX87732.1 conserved hypothetical protein [Lebetimonas natsushimae]
MKKIFYLIFVLNFLFSYEITNQKTFEIKYTPNIYKTKLNIKIKNSNLEKLIQKINFNIKKANLCQKIDYTIFPEYIYNKNKKQFIGYIANMDLNCQFKTDKIKNFSNIFTNLTGEKTLSSIYLDLDKKEKIKLINNLKAKAYSFAINDAKNISKKLNLKCFTTNISINQNIIKPRPLFKTLNSLPSPKENKKESLTIFYRIICF